MKVKCKKATRTKTHIFSKDEEIALEGLTEGKIYEAQPVVLPYGDTNVGNGSIYTHIMFLVCNDDGNFNVYNTCYFGSAE